MSNVVKKELPESWEWQKLGDVVTDIIGGGTPSKANKKYWEGSIPWLTIKDMRTRRPVDTIDHITQEAIADSATNLIPADTVIMATRVGLGKVVRVPYATTINQDLKALIVPPELDKAYLEYWLVSRAQYLESIGSGTTVKGIRLEQVKSLDFPLAPLDQQKRIVAKIEELFSHIDAGIAALNQAKQLLKQYRQSVLKAAVTGELTKEWREQNKNKLEPASQLLERILQERHQKWEAQQLEQFKAKGKMPKDDKWKQKYKEPEEANVKGLPALPEEWVWVRLDSVAFVGSGMSVSKSRKVADPVEVAYLRVANVQRGYLALDEIKKMPIEKGDLASLELQEWDVLYNEGGDIDKLGRGWIWENQIHPCITQNHVFRASPYVKNRQHSVFLSTWGNTFGQDYFIDTGKQTTNLASINKGVLSAFPTPLPSLEEQYQIIEIVEEKLGSISRLEREVDTQLLKAEKNKQSILASAFSGGFV